MIFIGIDPGKSGGFAITGNLDIFSTTAHIWDDKKFIDTLRCLQQTFEFENNIFCVVEKVHSMPKQGVASTFNFGKSAGFIEGVLQAYNIPYQLVTPQSWKKEFNLIGTDKKASIATAQKLFPLVNLLPTERSRVPSDGMAESLLMAEYARRIYNGKHK